MYTTEMIDKIHDIVLSDRRIKVRKIVETTDISQGTVFSVLHEKLSVKKISARWVRHLISEENKRNRVDGQNYGIKILIVTTSTIFTEFGYQ